MSIRIGGPHKCSSTGFTTESEEEWDNHCKEHETHTISGTVGCISCKKPIEMFKVPYNVFTTTQQCDECHDKQKQIREQAKQKFREVKQNQQQTPAIERPDISEVLEK